MLPARAPVVQQVVLRQARQVMTQLRLARNGRWWYGSPEHIRWGWTWVVWRTCLRSTWPPCLMCGAWTPCLPLMRHAAPRHARVTEQDVRAPGQRQRAQAGHLEPRVLLCSHGSTILRQAGVLFDALMVCVPVVVERKRLRFFESHCVRTCTASAVRRRFVNAAASLPEKPGRSIVRTTYAR